jgi:predicted Zn finger-like uncharacterized protein
MDVICERCKAEYEFDEALLGEKGTTVKCSACGHVFRVMPPNRELGRSHLKLRYARDGSVHALTSLRELQQRIRAGEVSVDDELGRDGFPFRPLREVPELKNFFNSSLDKTTVRPDASRLGDLSVAEQTVVASMPGGSAGATLGGLSDVAPGSPTSMPPPLPASRTAAAREARETAMREARDARDAREALAARAAAAHFAAREAAEAARQADAARQAEAVPPHEAVQVHQTVPASFPPPRATPSASTAPSAQPAPSAGPPSGLPEPKLPPEARSRSFTKQTMMGVGPEALQLPPPPRVPSFGASPPGPVERASPSPETAPVGAASVGAAPLGIAAGSPAPVRGAFVRSRPPASQQAGETRGYERAGASQPASPHATLHGTPGPLAGRSQPGAAAAAAGTGGLPSHADASHGRGGTLAPVYGVPVDEQEHEQDEHERESESELVAPHDVPGSAAFGYTSVDDLVERLEDEQAPPVLDVPDANRRLYLDDSERPPQRVDNDGGSKLWTYALLLLSLGGGAWFLWDELGAPTGDPMVASEPSFMPSEQVDAAAEPELGASALEAQGASDSALEPQAAAPLEPHATPAPEQHAASEVDAGLRASPEPKPAPSRSEPAAEPRIATAAKTEREPSSAPSTTAPAAEPSQPKADRTKTGKDSVARAEPAAERAVPAGDYSGLVDKGDHLLARGDHEGAQKAFQAALSARASGSEANTGMGFVLLGTGKAREALPYFDRAASSGYAEASIGLGDAYRKLGQPSSAIEAYQSYLDRLSRGARADYARSQIDKLKGSAASPSDKPETPWNGGNNGPGNGYRPAGELSEPASSAKPSENRP